ncbi:MAG: SDR family oxidoreductase [Deltaproteobacteria bacterium]|nr:SDR family oxidoreductase [Deltaproteobacteria bacterium]
MTASNCVLVAGATGRAGRLVVKELLKRGYNVRALMVRPFDAPETSGLSGVEFADGDLASVPVLERAMQGAQYVISALGSKKPFSGSENNKIDNMGNQNLARAAQAQGLRHIVVISSIGAGNSRDAVSCMYRWPMLSVLKAKTRSEDFIRSCGIDYTIIRPGGYTDEDIADEIAFGEGGRITGRVKRAQIARVCVDALENPSMKNRTFEVVARARVREGREQFIITLQ